MKKLILLFLISMSSMCASQIADMHMMYRYKNLPQWSHDNDAFLQSLLITASWCAKYEIYTFEAFNYTDVIVFAAHTEGCSFFLRYYRETHHCEVEFNASDDSFDQCAFKQMMDSYFLHDE